MCCANGLASIDFPLSSNSSRSVWIVAPGMLSMSRVTYANVVFCLLVSSAAMAPKM